MEKAKSFYDAMKIIDKYTFSECNNQKLLVRTWVIIGTVWKSGTFPVLWVPDNWNFTALLFTTIRTLYLTMQLFTGYVRRYAVNVSARNVHTDSNNSNNNNNMTSTTTVTMWQKMLSSISTSQFINALTAYSHYGGVLQWMSHEQL
jgi:hypothetical protein